MQDIVGDGADGLHFHNVVDADDVCATEHAGGNRSGCREHGFAFRRMCQERFARGSGEDRQIEAREFAEPRENFRVLLAPLAKADAGIDDDAKHVHTGAAGAVDGCLQIFDDGSHNILQRSERSPRLGPAAHVVEDDAGVVFDNGFDQQRIEGKTTGIVDDIDAEFERAFGDFRFVSVDGDGDGELIAQAFENRNQAAKLLGGIDGLSTGTSGFGSDVDDISALFFHFHGARVGAIRIEVLVAVGERIGCDVEHAHDERSFAKRELTRSDFPGVQASWHKGESLVSHAGEKVSLFWVIAFLDGPLATGIQVLMLLLFSAGPVDDQAVGLGAMSHAEGERQFGLG
jgi:hypothetical protein